MQRDGSGLQIDQALEGVRGEWVPTFAKDKWRTAFADCEEAFKEATQLQENESSEKKSWAEKRIRTFEETYKGHIANAAANHPLLCELLLQYNLEQDVATRAILISVISDAVIASRPPEISERVLEFMDYDFFCDPHPTDAESLAIFFFNHDHNEFSGALQILISELSPEQWGVLSRKVTSQLTRLEERISRRAIQLDTHTYEEISSDTTLVPFHATNGSVSIEDLVAATKDPTLRREMERLLKISLDTTPNPMFYVHEGALPSIFTLTQKDDPATFEALKSVVIGARDNRKLADIAKALDLPDIREVLQSNLSLDLNLISRSSQIQLFTFLGDCDQQTFDRLRTCLRAHREIAPLIARSMIAYAEKKETVSSLLSLAEDLPTNTLATTLVGFLNIAEAALSAEHVIASRNLSTDGTAALTNRVRQMTLGRANRLLESWGRMLTSDIAPNASSNRAFVELAKQLEGDAVIFAALFKEEVSKSVKSLEEICHINISQVRGGSLATKDIERMKAIQNYNSALLYPPRFGEIINNLFDGSLRDAKSRFYVLRINDSIEGFARFVDETPGSKYFGSFNLSPALESFGIGGRFLEEMLIHEGRECRIRLNVSGNNPFLTAYEKKYGFLMTGTTENCDLGMKFDEPSGVIGHEMVRYPSNTQV
jgi:hypothetical protein